MCRRVTHKNLIIAVLAATVSLCALAAIAQQVEPNGTSPFDVAPSFSPDMLRNAIASNTDSNPAATSAPAESELIFSPLPASGSPADSPLIEVTPVERLDGADFAMPADQAFPQLPGLPETNEGITGEATSVFTEQPDWNQEANPAPINQEFIEIQEAQSLPGSLAAPGSLALPPGINAPLADAVAGETVLGQGNPVEQPAAVPQNVPDSFPLLEDRFDAQFDEEFSPETLAIPETFSQEVSQTIPQADYRPIPQTNPQPAIDIYGFQNSQPVPSSTPINSFAFDPAAPIQNPVPRNTFPIQQNQINQTVAGNWQAPFTPTQGHNERTNMRSDLSLMPPPITGRPLEEYLPVQAPAFGPTDRAPNFDPSVGHRSPEPTRRFDSYSLNDGEKFDYETKKREFPPFGEIIATGRFFYNPEILWAEPNFQGNTLIATQGQGSSTAIPGDFDSDFQPRFRFGFESSYGPGIELTYFNINSNSELASFTSDGIISGQTSASVTGIEDVSQIFADDVGEQLVTQHSIDIDSFAVSVFKELKFPISRVNGNFGFQYVSIAQRLNANVTSAAGANVASLQTISDMRAFGPRAIIEYYRPIGHTPLELVTSFGGAVLFGQRDQFVTNSQTGTLTRVGADEFLTILDFFVGVQYKKNVGENRAWYGRFGFLNQSWIGGGSAASAQGDFGLRGLTFGIGYNR